MAETFELVGVGIKAAIGLGSMETSLNLGIRHRFRDPLGMVPLGLALAVALRAVLLE